MTKYLIVNIGSTSKKYAICSKGQELFSSHLKKEENRFISDILFANKLVEKRSDIKKIGIRIVAPGSYFLKNRIINQQFLAKLKEVEESAPLHITPVLEEIRQLRSQFPDAQIIGISDSAFHSSIPNEARTYGIPESVAKKYHLHRYGYHGISFQSAVEKNKLLPKTIICHLGGGSSVCAIKNGRSIDTTMGFTPLEGLLGGTRVGDIGPGATIQLGKKLKLSYKKLEQYLNQKCGFIGLGGSSDMRILLNNEKSNDKKKAERAKHTIDTFIYKIKKYIGAYSTSLGGVDMLIFTGVMAEESDLIRARVCQGLEYLGIKLDKNLNKQGLEGPINSKGAKVKILISTSEEMKKIYKEALKVK